MDCGSSQGSCAALSGESSELGGLRPADVLAASERRSVLPWDHAYEALDLCAPVVEQARRHLRAGAGEVLGEQAEQLLTLVGRDWLEVDQLRVGAVREAVQRIVMLVTVES